MIITSSFSYIPRHHKRSLRHSASLFRHPGLRLFAHGYRELQFLDAIVQNVCRDIHIINVKIALHLSLFQNTAKQNYFILVKVFSYSLYPPDISEKLARKVPFRYTTILMVSR